MAPVAISDRPVVDTVPSKAFVAASSSSPAIVANQMINKPLSMTGILDNYKYDDLTPVIGREYPTIQIRDLLNAPNSEELLREMAIISEWAVLL